MSSTCDETSCEQQQPPRSPGLQLDQQVLPVYLLLRQLAVTVIKFNAIPGQSENSFYRSFWRLAAFEISAISLWVQLGVASSFFLIPSPNATWPASVSRCAMTYLLTPQRVVVCALGKQEVLQQPEQSDQAGAERQNHTLGLPQVRQRRLQHHLQQAAAQSNSSEHVKLTSIRMQWKTYLFTIICKCKCP